VFFESVHRVKETLHDLVSIFGGDRRAFIGREISKLHEQCKRATLSELFELIDSGDIVARGEFVIVVAGTTVADTDQHKIDADSLLQELVVILPGSQAVDIVTRLSGRKRNEVYKEMLQLTADKESN
jgi:16S rRNA (cytidine1402-2'-O)-methyltransferase